MSDTKNYPRPPFPPQETGPPPGSESGMDPQPRFKAPDYKAAGKLEGLVALITGADSGIGRSVATLFAREGADVAIGYLEQEQADADETARAVRGHNRKVLMLPGDVREPDVCERIVEQTVKELGRLDVLVNNAAFQNHVDKVEDVTIEQWDRTFRTNIYAYFYMVQAALKHFESGATIINTGSITGLEGSAGLIDYASTKGAIHAFTKSLAKNLADRRIRVNCVAPGPVWTPLNPAERSQQEVEQFGKKTPFSRPAQPEEVAPAYVFFASNADSPYITGEVLTQLGGGTTAG